jgi:hypothetical protein
MVNDAVAEIQLEYVRGALASEAELDNLLHRSVINALHGSVPHQTRVYSTAGQTHLSVHRAMHA